MMIPVTMSATAMIVVLAILLQRASSGTEYRCVVWYGPAGPRNPGNPQVFKLDWYAVLPPSFVPKLALSANLPQLTDPTANPDATDLAPDNNYYFFYGSNYITANKLNGSVATALPISNKFATIMPPVIAAFSIGPLSGKMYIIDSSPTDKVKVYNFSGSSTPIQPNATGSLSTFFPNSEKIPQPLLAAAASFTPARVYFFGGEPPVVLQYYYNTWTAKFTPVGDSTTKLSEGWPLPIRSATMYYNPQNGVMKMFVFSPTNDAQFGANLAILRGSSATDDCNRSSLPQYLRRIPCTNATAPFPGPGSNNTDTGVPGNSSTSG